MRLLDVTLRLSYEQRVILHDAALHLAIQFEKQGKGFPENLQAILTRLDEAGALFVNHTGGRGVRDSGLSSSSKSSEHSWSERQATVRQVQSDHPWGLRCGLERGGSACSCVDLNTARD
jgi:hypothetical protein